MEIVFWKFVSKMIRHFSHQETDPNEVFFSRIQIQEYSISGRGKFHLKYSVEEGPAFPANILLRACIFDEIFISNYSLTVRRSYEYIQRVTGSGHTSGAS